ncbi:S26 family signal peptidase [Gluconacetobacter entanii]|nr:S26 family signal peptidase [Gluconacetobacter entanii]
MRWKRNRSIVIAAVCVLRRAPCSPCCAGHRRSAARQPAASISCGHPIRVPEGDADRLARGDYLPRGVPLLKPVAAIGGQTVCRTGSHIVVDGLGVGEALTTDHRGRPLPVWQGCHRLDAREIFVMNTHEPRSLDGRYFGPLRVSSVIGRATPLWVAADSVPAAGLSSPRFLQDH